MDRHPSVLVSWVCLQGEEEGTACYGGQIPALKWAEREDTIIPRNGEVVSKREWTEAVRLSVPAATEMDGYQALASTHRLRSMFGRPISSSTQSIELKEHTHRVTTVLAMLSTVG